MRRFPVLVASVAAVGFVLASDLSACGESMFRVGKGVHYRAYSAPLPGIVMVYARTDAEREVAEQLRRAGHDVLVVDSDIDLSMNLRQRNFDVIVAPASKRAVVEATASDLGAAPSWVPVTGADESEELLGREYRYAVDSSADVRSYLKAIHKSLKHRSS